MRTFGMAPPRRTAGRGERIRTSGIKLPKLALYLAELRPDSRGNCQSISRPPPLYDAKTGALYAVPPAHARNERWPQRDRPAPFSALDGIARSAYVSRADTSGNAKRLFNNCRWGVAP